MKHLMEKCCLKTKIEDNYEIWQGDQCGPSDVYKKVNYSIIGIWLYPKNKWTRNFIEFCCYGDNGTF